MDWTNRLIERLRTLASEAEPVLRGAADRVVLEAQRLVDRDRWKSATTLQERAQAVSWPRASFIGAGLAAIFLGLWMMAQPHGIQAHAPPLPTKQQLAARVDAARALEADLSPALARANQTVREEPAR